MDEALDIHGDAIHARALDTRMTVPVLVNGHGPYRFVVDSGADSSVVGERIARTLELPAGAPALLNGMTASSRVERVYVDGLQLGRNTFRDLLLPALQEKDLGADGMIGIDALVEQRLMLDFENRLIKVEDAQRTQYRAEPGEIVVVARLRRGQLILTHVSANRKAVDAVIDTGSQITIGNRALRDLLVHRDPRALTTIGVTGVTGVKADLQLAQVAELRVGSVTLRNVPIAFAEVPPFAVFGLSDHPALLLGTDILASFRRVSLDFRDRKVRFQLRQCGSTGISISTTPSASLTRLSASTPLSCRR